MLHLRHLAGAWNFIICAMYSAPSSKKSVVQEYEGEIPFEEVGFAFNRYFLKNILRDKLGLGICK